MGKGSDFERKLCKIFSLWWTNNERDDVFWRTSQSGGRATERQKKGKKTAGSYGDMESKHTISKPFEKTFLVEFKKGYNKDISTLILIDGRQKEPVLLKWWKKNEQIRLQCTRPYSLLIFQRDHRHPCIMMTNELFSKLEMYCGKWEQSNIIQINFVKDSLNLTIIPFYPFLEWCDSESMKLFIEGLIYERE